MADPVWEKLYQERPQGFRNYPGEELLRFLGRNFFHNTSPKERQNIAILEVGCGNGANLWAVAKEGFHAYGIDASPKALELAQQTMEKWGVQADLREGDVCAMPYTDESFHAVFDVTVYQCLTFTNLGIAYKEAYRVLKKGGVFFSNHYGRDTWDYDHGDGNLIDKHTFDNISNPNAIFPDLGTVCMPEVSDVEHLLNNAGFVDIQIENIIKTVESRTKQIQYMSISCKKP